MEILRSLDKIWKYMYRDAYGNLYLTTHKPRYRKEFKSYQAWDGNIFDFSCYNHVFHEVKGVTFLSIDIYRKGKVDECYLRETEL